MILTSEVSAKQSRKIRPDFHSMGKRVCHKEKQADDVEQLLVKEVRISYLGRLAWCHDFAKFGVYAANSRKLHASNTSQTCINAGFIGFFRDDAVVPFDQLSAQLTGFAEMSRVSRDKPGDVGMHNLHAQPVYLVIQAFQAKSIPVRNSVAGVAWHFFCLSPWVSGQHSLFFPTESL